MISRCRWRGCDGASLSPTRFWSPLAMHSGQQAKFRPSSTTALLRKQRRLVLCSDMKRALTKRLSSAALFWKIRFMRPSRPARRTFRLCRPPPFIILAASVSPMIMYRCARASSSCTTDRKMPFSIWRFALAAKNRLRNVHMRSSVLRVAHVDAASVGLSAGSVAPTVVPEPVWAVAEPISEESAAVWASAASSKERERLISSALD